METTTNKWILLLKIVAVIALIAGILFTSYARRSAQRVADRKNDPLYTWQSGGLRTQGLVTPQNCSITTTRCKCTLSANNRKCVFSFNFEGLNSELSIKAATDDLPSGLSYTTNEDCNSSKSSKIYGCTITYEWDKSKPVLANSKILFSGQQGAQPLLNVQIEAK